MRVVCDGKESVTDWSPEESFAVNCSMDYTCLIFFLIDCATAGGSGFNPQIVIIVLAVIRRRCSENFLIVGVTIRKYVQ